MDKRVSEKPVALIGFMGAGKSTVAQELHRMTGRSVVETDARIEAFAGCRIPEIMDRFGEGFFRGLETQVLEESLADVSGRIIATGGGIVERSENRALLFRGAKVVWLDVPFEVAKNRVAGDQNNIRPLFKNEGEALKRYERRRALYDECAHVRVDANESLGLIAERILEVLPLLI